VTARGDASVACEAVSTQPTQPPRTRPVRRAATRFPRARSVGPVAVLLLIALLASSCSPGGDELSRSRQSPERGAVDAGGATGGGDLSWATCTEEPASVAQLQCATLTVPMDHSDPDGEEIELALARSRSTGSPDERLGSVVFNPGGPGGSGIEFLASALAGMPAELAGRFDLVSFDPRGVGDSTPVRCLDDETKDEHLEGDLSPDTDADVQEAVEQQREFIESCQESAPRMVRHMSTADVAADLDLIREALGDEQLNYVGMSYGTLIGAVYATLFPDNVRAMVLDGAVSPVASVEERLRAQRRSFQDALASFVEHCDSDPDCALGPDSGASIEATRTRLDQQPLEVQTPSGPRTMGVDLFDIALATALYETSLWGAVATAIAQIDRGGATVLFTLVDLQVGRNPDGTYDNSSDAQVMVNCADEEERLSVDEGVATARRIIGELPTFGDALAWGALGCLEWPEPANPLPDLDGAGAPPIVVVGTIGDPATPYEWSEQMTDALESAVLLTYEGDGHAAFLRGGPCIDDAVVAYLVDLEVPPDGTSCPAQADAVSFAGLRDEIVDQFVTEGLPQQAAECIVDGVIEEVGSDGFDQLVLSQDTDQLLEILMRQKVACATGGG
jgi:pimeloyl-ACP methyl ester carboxylesterase